jgi:chromosome segregation ATPase
MTSPSTHERADDVYERVAELADEAAWYRGEQRDAAERAAHLAHQIQAATGADQRLLRRLAAAQARHAELAGHLASQAEADRQTLMADLPEPDLQTLTATAEDPRVDLGLRLHDALVREQAAAREANRHFAAALAARPWQRTRRETEWLRGRYAEACVHAHTRTVERIRAEVDAVIRDRLDLA